MKKILVVGFVPYGYIGELVGKYPNVIWIDAHGIGMSDLASAMVEVVKMMDGVMFMDDYKRDRLPYEILCKLDQKPTYEKSDFPIDVKEEENA